MNEALQKFKETLNSSKTVAVRAGNTKNISKILSSYILHLAFWELGKQSSVECGQIDDSTKNFLLILLGEEQKKFETPEHTVIKIDTEKIPVSELKYEKVGTILKIILHSPQNFDPKKIMIEKEKTPVDLLLLVDPEEKEIETILQDSPHKEVVKITSKDKSIPLKTFELVSSIEKNSVEKFKEAFWALLEEENEFSKSTISAKKEILELNPDISKITKARNSLKTGGFWKLLGRALQRSELDKDLGTIWTFITWGDIQKTNQTQSAMIPLFNEIKKLHPPEHFLVILWQEETKTIKAILGGEEYQKLKNLASGMGYALSSSYFFAEGFTNFSEAEIKIRSEIKKMIQ